MAKSLRRQPTEAPAPDSAAEVRRGIRRLRRVARDVGEPVEELVPQILDVLGEVPEAASYRRAIRRDPDLREAAAKFGDHTLLAALMLTPLRVRWMTFMESTRIIQERMLAERGGVPFPDSTSLIREDRDSH